MKRLGSAFLCSLLFPFSALAAQQPPAGNKQEAPSSAQSASAATKGVASGDLKAPDYSQEPFVIEQFHTRVRFENDGTGERSVEVHVRVQSDAGVQQLGELVFSYSEENERLEIRYVRVRKADGTVVTASADAAKEMTAAVARDAPVYTDYKEKHVTVPSLHPGDVLEYEVVTRVVTPVSPGQFWFDYSFVKEAIVLDERLDVDLPRGRVKQFDAPSGIPSETAVQEGREVRHWKRANLSRPTGDEQSQKKTSAADPSKPDVRFTTFASWDDVARWYAKLEQDRIEPTPEIRAKTEELIQGRSGELEKIEALYGYVAKNVRYVSLSFGLGRYQPHAAAEVLANQYGDCKDKHTLLAAMLKAAGISSYAVLIPSSRKLDESMPSPSEFDHVITAVPKGTELMWMDSTAEVAPFRLLAAPLRGKSALLVAASGAGRIVKTPADPPFLSTQQVEIDAQVNELGKLNAKLRYTLRGDNELALRVAFRRTPQTKWKELGQTIASMDGIRGEVTSARPSDPSDTQKPFILELEYSQANFLDWSSKKSKVALPLLTLGLPDVPDDNGDTIKLGSPLDIALSLKLALPENLKTQAPVAVSVSRDYADFQSSYRFENHTLTAKRTLNFKLRELPASRSEDYHAFERAVESDESQTLVVANSSSGSPTIPAAAKPDELIESGLAALNAGNPRAAIPLFERVVELDPQHKQAWNDLGLAHLRLGQFDEAATAFRKQIEVNPYDERAYDYLGLALQQQQKYAEAAEAFLKQIEVNPLDALAHSALGGLYLEQHKYADAVPELEKATILAPDDAGLQVSLGQAYLNTDDKEKALAAFEKAAQMAQTPMMWNNVAYSLADHQLQLEKAQQYAESAVAATGANLRNADLAHLTLDTLAQVVSIGVYWDTLGWVYFQKGDLPAAERYVRASWLLNQHGEVADHLGQIYEKNGHKDQALQMYAMAESAVRPVPETRARLGALAGGDPKIDAAVASAKPELVKLRSFPAGKLLNEDAKADFLVLLSPDGRKTRVEAVQFVSGSAKLAPFADKLRSLEYGQAFPDEAPTKLVRRGTLSCTVAAGDCTFTLTLPENVRTLN
jgi:tetratricopeptide (TPR) repeat protein/transglutaminase-like putative cysteine protease